MSTVPRLFLLAALLCVPIVVVVMTPTLLGAVANQIAPAPRAAATAVAQTQPSPVAEARPTVALDAAPPPTLVPPTLQAAPAVVAVASPQPTGEKVMIANTGGIGGVLRAAPINGPQVAAL